MPHGWWPHLGSWSGVRLVTRGLQWSMRLLLAACLCLSAIGCSSIADMARSEHGQRVYGGTRHEVAWLQGEEIATHDGFTEKVIGVIDFPFSLALDTAFFPVTLVFAFVRVNEWSLDR